MITPLRFVLLIIGCNLSTLAWAITADEGKFNSREINLESAHISVSFAPGNLSLSEETLLSWVESSAQATEAYYGAYPVAKLQILIQPVKANKIVSGMAMGGDVPYIMIRLGNNASEKSLRDDWVLVHEMVHLALPQVHRRHHWLEEGLATYIEPHVRIKSGAVDEQYFWRWMIEGLPNGLPPHNTTGLDNNDSWGNTYWGGTLFCFLADLEIRKLSGGTRGLKDALIGIIAAGGNMKSTWSIRDILSAGDLSVGYPTLNKLYTNMAEQISDTDLPSLWQQLGVQKVENDIVFNDSAPLAWLRESMLNQAP